MRWNSALATIALVAFMAGCSNQNKVNKTETSAVAKIRSGPQSSARDHSLKEGILALEKGDYDKATVSFHTTLNANPQDSLTHFLAGYTAHMEAKSGKTDAYQTAEVAYKAALSNEPSNKFASMQLARVYMETKRYNQAQERFAEGLLISPDDADLLQGLAEASYMGRDLKTALKTMPRVLELRPTDPDALRTASLVYAAAGKKEKAQEYFASFKTVSDTKTANYIESRLQDWSRIHTGNRFTQLAQADAAPAEQASAPAPEAKTPMNMALVDVILLRTEESGIQESGKNIMKQLQAVMGQSWASTHNKIRDNNTGTNRQFNTGTTTGLNSGTGVATGGAGALTGTIPDYIMNTEGYTLTKAFGLQTFNYALNIANTINNSSEVIARPTLVALDGKMSSFFSGSQLVVGLTGSIGGGQLDRERVGIHLEFVPKFLKNGSIEFQVSFGRSFPEAGLNSGLSTNGGSSNNNPFATTFQMALGELTANVVMDFGQTLILAGLSEREVSKQKSGFPILKDIPLVQYFFSESKNLDYHKHLVVMMTPRKTGFRGGNDSVMDDSDRKRKHLDRFLLAYAGDAPMEPNMKHTFAGLQGNTFYKEFRTGDVPMDRWFHTKDRTYLIKQTIDMFYF